MRREGTGVGLTEASAGGLVEENSIVAQGAVVQCDGVEDRLLRLSNRSRVAVESEQVVLDDLIEYVSRGESLGHALRLTRGGAAARLRQERAVEPLQGVFSELILRPDGVMVAVEVALEGGAKAGRVLLRCFG